MIKSLASVKSKWSSDGVIDVDDFILIWKDEHDDVWSIFRWGDIEKMTTHVEMIYPEIS